ncbi:hypothetical protein [Rickettsiella endosymbiont of Litargus connexus]|jgi:F0F1-type ATP synthase delta subunit|uniref:hypothetical protein n=1 Tax=Rickettsiella endosymbiont of Litargus connexus TaxID=3066237 RepID=UPI00376EEA2A
MNIKDKFSITYNIICSMEYPKKGELLQGFKELKELFAQPFFSESITDTIHSLKNNLVYKIFELENDAEFFKAFIKKIENYLMFNEFLEASSTISYSYAEREVFEQQIPKFKLFFEFDNELRKEAKLFYELYAPYLNRLHEILFSNKIKYEAIKWFIQSPFCNITFGSSISFQESLNNVFQFLLKNDSLSLTKKNIEAIKKIIDEKNNQKIPVNYNMFFFHVPLKAKTLSPLAKDALKNNLEKYITPII